MQNSQRTKWGFRIRLTLGLILCAGWGFLLGVALVRGNAGLAAARVVESGSFAPGVVFVRADAPFAVLNFVAVLWLTFFGSVTASLAFHSLMRADWPKLGRLLVALLFVSAGMVPGLLWELWVLTLDPMPLVNATGALIWNVEWAIAIVGLVGGTWFGWAKPLSEWLVRFTLWVLARPLHFLRLIARTSFVLLASLARFFQIAGHAFVWVPMQLLRLMGGAVQGIGAIGTRLWLPRPASRRRRRARRDTPETVLPPAPARRPRLNLPIAHNTNPNGGPCVVGYVEDRCPYCLDIVKRNDPRGVRVCEVCGAPHHADCWSVTGKCQVLHLNK